MADKKINIDIVVNTLDSAKSIKEIKSALKEASNAALEFGEDSAEFEKVTAAAGALADKVEDVNNAIKAKKGTAFEQFGGELGRLGDKLGGLDFKGANESIKRLGTQLKGVDFKSIKSGISEFGSTMKTLGTTLLANPIFLLVATLAAIAVAVYALVKVFIFLKDKVKVISEAFAFLVNIVDKIIQSFKDLSDWIGISSFAAEEAAEKQIDAAKKVQKANEEKYGIEIRLAKAAGKDVTKLELEKEEANREQIKKQLAGLEELRLNTGKYVNGVKVLNDEQKKDWDKLQAELLESFVSSKEKQLEFNKKANDKAEKDAKEAADKAKKAGEERAAANKVLSKQIEDQKIAEIEDIDKRERAAAELANKRAIDAINTSKAAGAKKKDALIEQEITFNNTIKKLDEKVAAEKKALDDQQIKGAQDRAKADRDFAASNETNLTKQLELKKQNLEIDNKIKQAELDSAVTNAKTEKEKIQAEQNLLNFKQKAIQENKTIDTQIANNAKDIEKQKQADILTVQVIAAKDSYTLKKKLLDDQYKKDLDAAKGNEEAIARIKAEFAEKDDNLKKERLGKFQAEFAAYANITQETLNGLVELQQAKDAEKLNVIAQEEETALNSLNTQRDAEIAASQDVQTQQLADATLTEEQKTAIKAGGEAAQIAIRNKYAIQEYQIKLKAYNEETAIKKKAFEQNQKLAIATALIQGAVGIVSALGAPFPLSIVAAALAAVTTVLSIAKIKATKFDGGGSPPQPPSLESASASTGVPTTGSDNSGGKPKLNDFSLFGTAGKANNLGGKPEPIRAVVLESDITTSQKRVEGYKNAAEL